MYIVFDVLQVWSKDDYSTLKNRLSTVLPHSYYFYRCELFVHAAYRIDSVDVHYLKDKAKNTQGCWANVNYSRNPTELRYK
jgi:hypothetical protein